MEKLVPQFEHVMRLTTYGGNLSRYGNVTTRSIHTAERVARHGPWSCLQERHDHPYVEPPRQRHTHRRASAHCAVDRNRQTLLEAVEELIVAKRLESFEIRWLEVPMALHRRMSVSHQDRPCLDHLDSQE